MSSTDVPITWPQTPDEYVLLETLGCGCRETTHLGFCKTNSTHCIIKIAVWKKINNPYRAEELRKLLNDIKVVSSYSHENLVPCYASFLVNEEIWLVMKQYEAGSLFEIISRMMVVNDCTHGVLDETLIATVLAEVLKGLIFLHDKGQMHGDIKAANILLGADGSVALNVFLAPLIVEADKRSRGLVRNYIIGTPGWIAPEILELEGGYNIKADIWTFGITAIELVKGASPYAKYSPLQAAKMTLKCDPPTLDTGLTKKHQFQNYKKSFRDMIKSCLQKDPSSRPTASELLQHSFFKKAKDSKQLCQQLAVKSLSILARVKNIGALKTMVQTKGLFRTFSGEWTWDEHEQIEERNDNNIVRKSSIKRTESTATTATNISHVSWVLKQKSSEMMVLDLVLKIRNKKYELFKVSFKYNKNQDTPERLAEELVSAGLVDSRDGPAFMLALEKLLKNKKNGLKSVVFALNSAGQYEHYNDKTLIGFAEVSVA